MLLTGFLTNFTSSVWNFCRLVADVSPRGTSPAAKSKEKQMFSQARGDMIVTSSAYKVLLRSIGIKKCIMWTEAFIVNQSACFTVWSSINTIGLQ